MTDAQRLYWAIGVTSADVMLAMLGNALMFRPLLVKVGRLETRIGALEAALDRMFRSLAERQKL